MGKNLSELRAAIERDDSRERIQQWLDKLDPTMPFPWEEREAVRPMVTHANALPCKLCGGSLTEKYYDAFSGDSSFSYIGCSGCDVDFGDTDTITNEEVARWNKLMA